VRALQARVIMHPRRAMRLSVPTGLLAAAAATLAIASNPHAWWLAVVVGASLELDACTGTKARHVVALADASAVRWWMRATAYANGMGGAGALAWALRQLAARG
jgi:hypothetical protein